jgi:hypothetical protein
MPHPRHVRGTRFWCARGEATVVSAVAGFIRAGLVLLVLLIAHRSALAQPRTSATRTPFASGTPNSESARHPQETVDIQASLPEAAQPDFAAAMMLFDAGDYAGALLKFQLAYDKSSDARLLWDLAVCEHSLRHYARALPLVHRYLAEAKSMITDAERDEAEALATAIAKFVGPIHIESDQNGATVLVDDVKVGKTPLSDAVLVDMGERKVTLRKHGYKEAMTTVRVLGPESEQHVVLRLERDMPAATLEVVAGTGQWIAVDDGTVGRDRWEGLVSPGQHVITVSGAGYKPKEVQADLSNGGHVTIWVVAQPLAASEKSNRWPLVAVLGSATAVIAIVAYYGLRSSETRAPVQLHGKLDDVSGGFSVKGWP